MAKIVARRVLAKELPKEVEVQRDITIASLKNVRTFKCAKVALDAVDANEFPFNWQNPENNEIIVHEIILNVTTVAAAGSILAVGVEDASGDVPTTAEFFDAINLNTIGTIPVSSKEASSGGDQQPHILGEKGGTNDWITAQVITENATGLVADAYIFYTEV